jgi:hypothetical protein
MESEDGGSFKLICLQQKRILMRNFGFLSVLLCSVSVFTVPAIASVTVNSPSSGEQVTSPFKLSAVAINCGSKDVAAMGYSFDSSSDTTIIKGQSINEPIDAPSGAHTLKVKAWGTGVACVQDVNIDVRPGGSGGSGGSGSSGVAVGSGNSVVPSNAISVSNLDTMSSWTAKHDNGGPGSSSGSTKVVSSPSVSGNAREFATSFSSSGDVRYSLSFADDTSARNFLYDTWVYVNSSASSIGNLEFDINQTMGDGKTVMFGIICDGYTNTWSYTVNTGSASSPRPKHIGKSGTHCNVRGWTQNKWHHLQAYYSHDSSGNITYHSVWLDGVESQLNETVPGSYALGWGPVINTQFQVDGLGSNHNTVYLSNLAVHRW